MTEPCTRVPPPPRKGEGATAFVMDDIRVVGLKVQRTYWAAESNPQFRPALAVGSEAAFGLHAVEQREGSWFLLEELDELRG